MTCEILPDGGVCDAVIEVEKKVFLTSAQRERLTSALPPGKEKAFWDVYYDGPAMQLTKRDWWLRQRQGAWELKVPVSFGQGLKVCQSYEEIEDPGKILRRLIQDGMLGDNPPTDDEISAQFVVHMESPGAESVVATNAQSQHAVPLERVLQAKSVLPFCRLHTKRTSIATTHTGHAISKLKVDMDTVTFDPGFAEPLANFCEASKEGPFVIAEVEMMVPKGEEGEAAVILEDFLALHGLADVPRAYSKVLEYLLRFRPGHLDALVAAGGVPREKIEKLRRLAADAAVPVTAA